MFLIFCLSVDRDGNNKFVSDYFNRPYDVYLGKAVSAEPNRTHQNSKKLEIVKIALKNFIRWNVWVGVDVWVEGVFSSSDGFDIRAI